MRPVFGRASVLPTRSLLAAFANNSRTFAPNASTSSWVCKRCHQQSQRTLHMKSLHVRQNVTETPKPFQSRPSILRARLISSDAQDKADKPRKDLPSQKEGRRSHISKRFSHLMDHLQSNIFIAGQRLNDLTGYSGIEALKKDIEQQETLVKDTRVALQQAREEYSNAISQRSSSQREVNELLQRKHAWAPNDLERFTALYRSDHANEQAELAAQQNLSTIERNAEEAAGRLSKSILARYHEEQIWSDKIRRMSTWGTWGLMGVNILLFLVFQIGVEPWRRRRLVKGFEEKVMEALEREGSVGEGKPAKIPTDPLSTEAVTANSQMVVEDPLVTTIEEPVPDQEFVAEDFPPGTAEAELPIGINPKSKASLPLSQVEALRERVRDLFSERQVVLRQVDLTTATIEGAAAGVAFVGMLVFLLRPR